MSQFDRYTTSEYVDALRVFMGAGKRTFLRDYGFVDENDPNSGRLSSYNKAALEALEEKVNAKAARCEAPDTTIGERYRLARDYKGLSDAQVAREMGVSRELVRRWGLDINTPSCIEELATFLNVPADWLKHGGEERLPANSHLGVRVGKEAMDWREVLYGLTQSLLAEIDMSYGESYVQAYIEGATFSNPQLAAAARKAGGRWQLVSNTLLFAPWVPIPEHGLSRRYWSDEVEQIIEEELTRQHSVYAAWDAIQARCKALGLGDKEYPRRISLHKRVEKERERAERFGVDINFMIANAVKEHQPH